VYLLLSPRSMPGLLPLGLRRLALAFALASSSLPPYKISILLLVLVVLTDRLLSPRLTRSMPGFEALVPDDLDLALTSSSSPSPYKMSAEPLLMLVAVTLLLVVVVPLLLIDMSSDECLLSLRLVCCLSSLLVPLGAFLCLGDSSSLSLEDRSIERLLLLLMLPLLLLLERCRLLL